MAKSFKSVSELNPDVVMVVDCLNLAFRWKHSGAREFLDEYFRTIESLRKSYKAAHVILLSDMGSSSYRKNLYPAYKANREELRANQTPEDEEAFRVFFQEFTRILETYEESDDYPVLKFPKVEADDIAGYIVKNKSKLGIKKIVLVSSDRDWDCFISEDVMRFSYVTRKEVTLENWFEHYEYPPEQHISVKCLMGDSGDNVPGVNKIGPKTAVKLLEQYDSTYEIIANMPLPGKYVYIKNLNEFGTDALMLNYQLMDVLEFCDEAIGEENCKTIEQKVKGYLNVT